MARPTKLTKETTETICSAIRVGATYQAAAEAAGIVYSTFNEWMKGGRKEYDEFSEAVRQANADAKLILLRNVQKAGKRDWRASAWMLEHRFADEYGGKDNVNLNLDLTDPNIPMEVLERLAKGESIFKILASLNPSAG